jgi:hypothetical protein
MSVQYRGWYDHCHYTATPVMSGFLSVPVSYFPSFFPDTVFRMAFIFFVDDVDQRLIVGGFVLF